MWMDILLAEGTASYTVRQCFPRAHISQWTGTWSGGQPRFHLLSGTWQQCLDTTSSYFYRYLFLRGDSSFSGSEGGVAGCLMSCFTVMLQDGKQMYTMSVR